MKASKNRPQNSSVAHCLDKERTQSKKKKKKKEINKKSLQISLNLNGSHCRSWSENLPASFFFAMVCLGILFGCKKSRSPTDYLLSALLLIAILSSLRLLCYFLSRFLKRNRRRRRDQSPDPADLQLQPQTDVDHLHPQLSPLPDNKLLFPAVPPADVPPPPPLAAFSRK